MMTRNESYGHSTKCSSCGNIKKKVEVATGEIYFCEQYCGTSAAFSDVHICGSHDIVFVKHEIANGAKTLRRQCLACGKMEGKTYKKKQHQNFNDLPSSVKVDAHRDSHIDAVHELRARYREKCEEMREQYRKTRMDLYYSSDEWAVKRLAVLRRDSYVCQCCHANPAKQVHHLTYENFENEPLWDLVSICIPCHKKFKSTRLVNKLA